MHQQLWGYKVEWKSVSRGTGGKKVEYHCYIEMSKALDTLLALKGRIGFKNKLMKEINKVHC
jgi:hypothetical protein